MRDAPAGVFPGGGDVLAGTLPERVCRPKRSSFLDDDIVRRPRGARLVLANVALQLCARGQGGGRRTSESRPGQSDRPHDVVCLVRPRAWDSTWTRCTSQRSLQTGAHFLRAFSAVVLFGAVGRTSLLKVREQHVALELEA